MRRFARSLSAIFLLLGSAAIAADDTPPPIERYYSPWTKVCQAPKDHSLNRTCFTGKDDRTVYDDAVMGVVIIESEGDAKPILRATVPLGVQLVHGTRLIVDSNPPQQSPYVTCLANGCTSDYEATPELIAGLRKGRKLFVQAINSDATVSTWTLPLRDFAAAYDGPAIASATFEQQQQDQAKKARRLLLDDTLDRRYRPWLQ